MYLKKAEAYFLTVLEARSLKSRWWREHVLSETSFWFSWFWQSLTCIVGTVTPISASVFMKHFPLYLCLNFPLIIKIPVIFHLESALHIVWPKYWSFSFSISLSSEYSGLISFRIDWFDLPAVQKTLGSVSSLALCLLWGPPLTCICDYWENVFSSKWECSPSLSPVFTALVL